MTQSTIFYDKVGREITPGDILEFDDCVRYLTVYNRKKNQWVIMNTINFIGLDLQAFANKDNRIEDAIILLNINADASEC